MAALTWLFPYAAPVATVAVIAYHLSKLRGRRAQRRHAAQQQIFEANADAEIWAAVKRVQFNPDYESRD